MSEHANETGQPATPKETPKPSRHPGGRPTKLTPERQDRLCQYLKAGSPFSTACGLVGIHKDTGYEWLKRGRRQKSGPFRLFSDAVEQAQAYAVAQAIAVINLAAHGSDGKAGDWRAAAWWLEHVHPRKFMRHVRSEVTGKGGRPVQTEQKVVESVAELTEQELLAIIAGGRATGEERAAP